eukprot:scaffold2473_cov247-Pinguiococcus_pyrenoidosus.AAC.14
MKKKDREIPLSSRLSVHVDEGLAWCVAAAPTDIQSAASFHSDTTRSCNTSTCSGTKSQHLSQWQAAMPTSSLHILSKGAWVADVPCPADTKRLSAASWALALSKCRQSKARAAIRWTGAELCMVSSVGTDAEVGAKAPASLYWYWCYTEKQPFTLPLGRRLATLRVFRLDGLRSASLFLPSLHRQGRGISERSRRRRRIRR